MREVNRASSPDTVAGGCGVTELQKLEGLPWSSLSFTCGTIIPDGESDLPTSKQSVAELQDGVGPESRRPLRLSAPYSLQMSWWGVVSENMTRNSEKTP